MDIFIYKGDSFYSDGKLSISIHQKETNKFMYIPFRSFHQRHTIKNFVWGELKRYVLFNMEEKKFKKLKTRFCLRLIEGLGNFLTKLFQPVTYSQRNKLLNSDLTFHIVCESLTIQEAEMRIIEEREATFTLLHEDYFGRGGNATNKISLFSNNNTTDQRNTAIQGSI